MAEAVGAVLRRHAWAKINLTLHITGRRDDGYHEIDSLIVFAGVGDEIEFTAASDISLAVDGPFAAALNEPTGPAAAAPVNLVLRAARALRAHAGIRAGARLRLLKNLPVAAGLGGGSADAAAALTGLAQLWGLGEVPALAKLAASLGADVPVCLAGRPSFVSGIGELLAPVPPLPPAWLVLANPGRPLATAAVFAARAGAYSAPRRWVEPIADAASLAARLSTAGNDLEPAARGLVPEIGEVLAALRGTAGCLLARMSGSGATCFGLYAQRATAAAAVATIRGRQPRWWLCAAPMRTDESEVVSVAT